MTINDFLFIVLRSALWGHKTDGFELPSKPYKQLYRLSQRQTVSGLLCSALMENQDVRLNRYDAANTYTSLNDTIQINGHMNSMVCELSELLSSTGIRHLIVKGQITASMYRQPEVRESGDIDFYCPTSCFSQARELIAQRWNVTFEEESESEQHLAFTYKDVLFEMHFNLFKFYNKANQRYWDSLMDEEVKTDHTVTVRNHQIPTLSPETNILYTFLHLFHHLVELGVGLRQFCDLAMMLHHYHGTYSAARLQEHLRRLGFEAGFKAVGAILTDRLGLPASEFPYELTEKDHAADQLMLDIIFTGGDFGKYGRKTAVRSGWKYYFEALTHKIGNYQKIYRLAPKEIRASLINQIPRKILLAFQP